MPGRGKSKRSPLGFLCIMCIFFFLTEALPRMLLQTKRFEKIEGPLTIFSNMQLTDISWRKPLGFVGARFWQKLLDKNNYNFPTEIEMSHFPVIVLPAP